MAMNRLLIIILSLLIFIAFSIHVHAQKTDTGISEPPYIYWLDGKLHAKWVENGKLKHQENLNLDFPKKYLGLGVDTEVLTNSFLKTAGTTQKYSKVSNITVISDIHGQYDLMVELLKNQGVIDENLNWKYGKGHLVINGDILDRGDKVTEILWLAFKLEQQAIKAGGKLHYLLGNHELMVLTGDHRYMNQKYVQAAEIMGTSFTDLYGFNSVLGHWIRQCPTIVSINDLLFVHAGISPEFFNRGYDAKKVNKIFFDQILSPLPIKPNQEEDYLFLTGVDGPVWYRGYFEEGALTEQFIDETLAFFKTNRIIVGHTSFETVTTHFGGKIIGVDSSVKNGEYGEVLIIENGIKFRGTKSGERIKLEANTD
ncbi:Calcineurin-like phosphoesterase [Aquiflexum balticum DSM 16537]|uniref:Calcineurin-like phosphoesterase n=2 Tax=Aquiflexum TaxID=280472 RepID=A0A1W2H2Y7_9BACT|nr:Calcineurin-like phosphoesterase [Aquiflexum balticum DSM 16537]